MSAIEGDVVCLQYSEMMYQNMRVCDGGVRFIYFSTYDFEASNLRPFESYLASIMVSRYNESFESKILIYML